LQRSDCIDAPGGLSYKPRRSRKFFTTASTAGARWRAAEKYP
jgi:hypothetical protein